MDLMLTTSIYGKTQTSMGIGIDASHKFQITNKIHHPMRRELQHTRSLLSPLAMARYRAGIGLGITLASSIGVYREVSGGGSENLVLVILPVLGTIFGGVGTRIAYKEMGIIEKRIIRSRQ